MVAASRSAEVVRILERYLVEVVERWRLCPWAQPSRARGGVAIGVLWGAPALDAWVDEAARRLAGGAQVAMVVAPELGGGRAALAALRDQVAARLPAAGVADFHPDAPLDLASPARAVAFLRRAPDPLLQLVPLAAIDAARAAAAGAPSITAARDQAAMLGGHAAPPRPALADQIAAANHATLTAAHAEITATLAAIAADRRASYARLGISASR